MEPGSPSGDSPIADFTDLEQAIGKIRGKPGTNISVTVEDPERGVLRTLELTRATIDPPAVEVVPLAWAWVLAEFGGVDLSDRVPEQWRATTRTLLGVVLGTSTGFVLGGVLGCQTVSAVTSVELQVRRVPAAEIVAGAAGLIAGLATAALLSVPIFRLPPLAAWTSAAFMYVVLGYVGYRVGQSVQGGRH